MRVAHEHVGAAAPERLQGAEIVGVDGARRRAEEADDADRWTAVGVERDTGEEARCVEPARDGEERVGGRVRQEQRRAGLEDLVRLGQDGAEIVAARECRGSDDGGHRQAVVAGERDDPPLDAEEVGERLELGLRQKLEGGQRRQPVVFEVRDELLGGDEHALAGGERMTPLDRDARRRDRMVLQHVGDGGEEIVGVDGLGQKEDGAATERLFLGEIEAGAEDHRRKRRRDVAAELEQELEAVHHRHDDIEDDEVGSPRARLLESVGAVLRRRDLVACLLQHELVPLADVFAVVDDQNARARLHGFHLRTDDQNL